MGFIQHRLHKLYYASAASDRAISSLDRQLCRAVNSNIGPDLRLVDQRTIFYGFVFKVGNQKSLAILWLCLKTAPGQIMLTVGHKH